MVIINLMVTQYIVLPAIVVILLILRVSHNQIAEFADRMDLHQEKCEAFLLDANLNLWHPKPLLELSLIHI